MRQFAFIIQCVLFTSSVYAQSKAIDITEIQDVFNLASGLHVLDAYEAPRNSSSMEVDVLLRSNDALPVGTSNLLLTPNPQQGNNTRALSLYNIKTGEWWTVMSGAVYVPSGPKVVTNLHPLAFFENILVVYTEYYDGSGNIKYAFVRITGAWPDAMLAASTTTTADLDQSGKVDSLDLLTFQEQWHTYPPPATGKNITIDIPNLPASALPLEMVLLSGGTFTMGSSPDERSRSENEWSSHEVTLTKSIYIGRYEVTKGQWIAIMGNDPSEFGGDDPNYPVERVSWNDCQEFIQELEQLGLGKFRLPTEAEWEYACRAGTTTRFWFGDALGCDDTASECSEVDPYMWWRGNISPYGTKRIGLKTSNSWDLFDMYGNVSELCQDVWEAPYDRGPQVDASGPEQGDIRVSRGGAFSANLAESRSAYRSPVLPTQSDSLHGFRLVREYP